ncbi:unnamed protein product, partial [Rotaria magnacalcarata]
MQASSSVREIPNVSFSNTYASLQT